MVKTVYLLTLLWAFSTHCFFQNYAYRHQSLNSIDPARSNRPVLSELYYPATTAGENTPLSTDLFPVIVFGHGFQMGYDSYLYFKNAIVPAGYILVFPKTETSVFPNHAEYGSDLAFLVLQMKAEGLNPSSPFFQHIDSTSAIMGHSMGGGASFLGCKNNPAPTTMVTWAAAETSPSAIQSATSITIPSLVISADKDCVTPPESNQKPMYDSLSSDCKVFINIIGGGHCYFAETNFICSLGEIGCPAFTISREQQHATVLDFTKLYLAYYLKNQSNAWSVFNDSLNNSPRITFQKSCTITSTGPGSSVYNVRSFPNPAEHTISLMGNYAGKGPVIVNVSDLSGTTFRTYNVTPEGNRFQLTIDMNAWSSGIYFAQIRSLADTHLVKILKY